MGSNLTHFGAKPTIRGLGSLVNCFGTKSDASNTFQDQLIVNVDSLNFEPNLTPYKIEYRRCRSTHESRGIEMELFWFKML